MINYLNYLFRCKNKTVYKEIGKLYSTSILNVYRIAHGGKIRSKKEEEIMYVLIQKGILTGIKVRN